MFAASLANYDAESANPLFTGSSGPKPPQALSLSVLGMKKGGKVRSGRRARVGKRRTTVQQ